MVRRDRATSTLKVWRLGVAQVLSIHGGGRIGITGSGELELELVSPVF